MKRILLSLSLLVAGVSQGQNLLSQNFDVFPGVAAPGTSDQWVQTNQSTPLGASTWAQGGGTAFPGAQAGAATSFTLCNYNSTTGAGTISNWLIAPAVMLKDGDVISFYTVQGGTTTDFPDRLEMRMAVDWSDFSSLPTGGAADVGSFGNVLVSVNPDLDLVSYPVNGNWTQYSYTVSGMPTETMCRVAFRYWVTNGGPLGANSNIIGVDTFSVDRPLSTTGFFSSNFSAYPNPASSVLNINSKSGVALNKLELTDLNGRVVKTVNGGAETAAQINISDLNSGVYFLKVTSDNGVGTTKVIKS